MSSAASGFSMADARKQVTEIFKSCPSGKLRRDLLEWIMLEFHDQQHGSGKDPCVGVKNGINVASKLEEIVLELRSRVPPSTVFPSESFVVPQTGENSDCSPEQTVHVDAFLYNDDDVDILVENGELQRNFCVDCKSRNTMPLNFISHSMSRERLAFIFNGMLPKDKIKKSPASKAPPFSCMLDVGSRLGGTLFAAHLYTEIPKIVGVELNSDFCNLKTDVAKKFKMMDRILIVEDDIMNQRDLVKESDLVFLNNPFEFFCERSVQQKLWRFLKSNLSKNTILICVPALEDTFSNLDMKSELAGWVKGLAPEDPSALEENEDELSEVHMYRVL